jgi:ATP-binding cassette subfamily B protein
MAKPDARLVILDEPFRGLERSRRTRLLQRARSLWRDATLLCITHDVSETENFDRVLIINGGRLVEDGVPKVLASRENSLYRAMLETEAAVQREFQESDTWRRLILEDGRLVEEPSAMQLVAPSRSESA